MRQWRRATVATPVAMRRAAARSGESAEHFSNAYYTNHTQSTNIKKKREKREKIINIRTNN